MKIVHWLDTFCAWLASLTYQSFRSFKTTHEARFRRAEFNGMMLGEFGKVQSKREAVCNHRKGGTLDVDLDGRIRLSSQGDSDQYAVLKHTFEWGDVWIKCLRCGRTWKPGDTDYEQALKFCTMNKPSGSIRFTHAGTDIKKARELTRCS